MENLKSTLSAEQTAHIQAEIDGLISTRRSLFHFVPTESNLVMLFVLADGNQVQIPIKDVYKVRNLIGEVRTYLDERELWNERKLNRN